tara:strand:- start:96 stop:305 length:210 start_codon:yes stop_codon:yes gene_type:complete
MRKAQTQKILEYLKSGKTISPGEALVWAGSFRLAARIKELRDAGYNIQTEMKADENGRRYARYRLVSEA